MIPGLIKALLPNALLRDPWTLQKRVALLVNEAGVIDDICCAENLPAGVPVERFDDEVWVAAPILAHAHLESFDAPSATWRRNGFTPWVEDLLTWRMQAKRLTSAESARFSLQELEQHGCGLVLSHVAERGAEGHARRGLPEVLPCTEVFAPDADSFSPDLLEKAKQNGGIALHAPYSVAPEIARQVFTAMRGHGLVSVHLGEHEEERAYLVQGTGPMAELLAKRERPMVGGQWTSPVDWLRDMGGLHDGVLAVHGGDLSTAELQELEAAGVCLVFCPGTHLYFNRTSTAYGEPGVAIPALGCDSRASNAVLDPLREVALAYASMPKPGAQAWWGGLTQNGARALHRQDLGSLEVGKLARPLRLLQVPEEVQRTAAGLCEFLCSGIDQKRQVSSFSAC